MGARGEGSKGRAAAMLHTSTHHNVTFAIPKHLLINILKVVSYSLGH